MKGDTDLPSPLKKTLEMLNLKKKHNCVVVEDTPIIQGMLKKVHSHVTWGSIAEDTVKKLKDSRKAVNEKVFRLNPPKGGFERKGIKVPYNIGGAAGKRPAIDDLILRMI
ncbi:uL30 family ribosomal protein [Candidatus Woesearchaeota archaeon]|nr:uL30 family ribosomal protein [Candidatus Woesearchaeota archaeon]